MRWSVCALLFRPPWLLPRDPAAPVAPAADASPKPLPLPPPAAAAARAAKSLGLEHPYDRNGRLESSAYASHGLSAALDDYR